MPLGNPVGGIGYAPEFQSSALPWVTSSVAPAKGSPLEIDFAKVTRFLTISNRDPSTTGSISVAFTLNGSKDAQSNKFIINGGQTVTLEIRIKSLWIQGEVGTGPYSLCAGLTTVAAGDMPLLSGTLPDGSAGWPGVG